MFNIWRRKPSGRIVSSNLLPLPNKGVSNIIANTVFEVTAPLATNNYTLSANPSSYSLSLDYLLSGFPISFLRASHYRLQPLSASYSFIGKDISTSIKVPPIANLLPSSYSLTGVAASFSRSRTVVFNAAPASYEFGTIDFTLTGFPVTFNAPEVRKLDLQAEVADFSVQGFSASCTYAITRTFSVENASYSLTGSDLSVVKSVCVLEAEKSDYTIAGSEALLLKPRNLVCVADSFALTLSIEDYILEMFDAATLVLRTFNAPSAEYTYTGFIANDPVLASDPAEYSISGTEASVLATRYSYPEEFAYTLDMYLARMSQQAQYPRPEFVLYDTIYGDKGQFIGTMKAVDKSNKFDIETGRFVKILSNKTVMSL